MNRPTSIGHNSSKITIHGIISSYKHRVKREDVRQKRAAHFPARLFFSRYTIEPKIRPGEKIEKMIYNYYLLIKQSAIFATVEAVN